jgi:hypothetical protein
MRTVQIEVKVFEFSELSESAKNRAISNWVATEPEHNWSQGIDELFVYVLGEIGLTDVETSFNGFSAQGDGASFNGKYKYRQIDNQKIEKLFDDFKRQKEKLRVLDAVSTINTIQAKYGNSISAEILNKGAYCNSGYMQIDVDNENIETELKDDRSLLEAFRTIADQYYNILYETYYDLVSDERAVKELSDKEFTETGKLLDFS